ncbi:arylsulfatase [Paenibacillus agaridevorans]|uniref:Arylsulfatase n=1 Tax=Paenibacillus agaridevorans TaxID=171404 RepID=A0A2R5ETN2_9BACL|nr:sulfatase-like hydrolase/transferase [Paenibacillus agaridevorans]GBG08408.1 arylsulfatase [Paenibacillus agaridevorans]
MRNILIIVSDQLSWKALPVYGGIAETPNIDRIANGAVVFDRCYTPVPLCMPARASFWSGVYPHETGVLSNIKKYAIPEDLPTIGEVFNQAGYDTVHFGKTHAAGALKGFWCEEEGESEVEGTLAWPVSKDTERDRFTTEKTVEYLEKNKHSDKPFLMIVDFVNPHDICSWTGKNKGLHEDVDPGSPLPPLPPNFEFDDIENRPDAVKYICCSHTRQAQTSEWSSESFRHYLAAYYHYIHRVDAEIGLVLDALEKSGKYEDTLIVFMADHGDSMACHGKVTKDVDFYEETNRVPFIFNFPEYRNQSSLQEHALTSLLDLFPTLCSYAGIEQPATLRGENLMPLITEQGLLDREYIIGQWYSEWDLSISPGRMVRTEGFKYTHYINDGEELFDLVLDPNETKNVAKHAAYAKQMDRHRKLLEEHIEKTKDNFMELNWKELEDDLRWRSHEVGYRMHRGPAVGEVGKGLVRS